MLPSAVAAWLPVLLATLPALPTLPGSTAETNITLLALPVNLTSWRTSLRRTLDGSAVRPLTSHLSSVLNDTLHFLRNGSVGCTPYGEECFPDVPSCCPGSDGDEDVQCQLQDDVYRCSQATDSEDAARQRLAALEYGDSAGQLESHAWADSWGFQSVSQAEREELQAQEDDEWKRNWKPSGQDNYWIKAYKKVKKEAINAWNDLRKMKKLKEVKDSLLDRKKKRLEPTLSPVVNAEPKFVPESTHEIAPEEESSPVTKKAARVLYPDELSEESGKANAGSDSEESVIKFSDELPKRSKKVDFRLDNIIRDAIDFASQKLKKQTEQGKKVESSAVSPIESEEEILRLDEIQGTVDKLMQEVNELKSLKTQREGNMEEDIGNKVAGPDVDELIRKHVHNILEEKRRLYELRQIEEAKKLKKDGGLKT